MRLKQSIKIYKLYLNFKKTIAMIRNKQKRDKNWKKCIIRVWFRFECMQIYRQVWAQFYCWWFLANIYFRQKKFQSQWKSRQPTKTITIEMWVAGCFLLFFFFFYFFYLFVYFTCCSVVFFALHTQLTRHARHKIEK